MSSVLDDLPLDEVLKRYSALLEQIRAMQEQAETMRSDALVRAADTIRALMKQYDLTLEDLQPPVQRAPYGSKKKQREADAEAARTTH